MSAIIGGLVGLCINECWRALVPSTETRELRQARRQITDLSHDVEKTHRQPDFQLLLNDIAITNAQPVVFPTSFGERMIQQAAILVPGTGRTSRLTLSVRNIGNLPAENLLIAVRLAPGIDCSTGGMWQPMAFATRTSTGIAVDDPRKSVFIQSPQVIDPGAYFTCDAIFITHDLSNPVVASLMVEVSALQAEKRRFDLSTILVYGEGSVQLIKRQ